MQVKLFITNLKDPDYKEEFTFDKIPVEIGRDKKNDIVLTDSHKLVSRQHAKIQQGSDGFTILDLLSRNFTFKNGEKLHPEKEYNLAIGDIIKIGEFNIEIKNLVEEAAVEDSQKTMVFSSPFDEELGSLAESLKKLSEKYLITEDSLKDEYLRMTILNTLTQVEMGNAGIILSDYLAGKYLDMKERQPQIENIPSEKISKEEKIEQEHKFENKSTPNQKLDYSFDSHYTKVNDEVLDTVVKLIQGFWQFRQEFFGVTIYQSLPTTSVNKLKEFLFDPALSVEESDKRMNLFKEELNKVLSHQVGLLEGYKESVNDGLQKVLQDIDPGLLEKKLKQEKFQLGRVGIYYRYIPFYVKAKLVHMIKTVHKKLRTDINTVERKYFRPAFMKGYQKRILARRENE